MPPKRETAMQLWGKELAAAREAAGMTGKQLAEAVHVAPSTVSQWESGKRTPHVKDVERVEEVLGTNGFLKRLLLKWVSRWVSPEWLGWLGVEENAVELLTFQVALVPGLLQTEGYAAALLPPEQVAQRLERQQILDAETPPLFVALLDESILYRKVGDARVMAEQLLHLAAMAERKDIVVRILPLNADACSEIAGPFVIATLDGGKQAAFVDAELTGRITERPEDIAALRRKWIRLSDDSLRREESIALIRKAVKERWRTP